MLRRTLILAAGAAALMAAVSGAQAQQTIKVGLILPLTGPFTSIGRQVEMGARLYMQQKGHTVAGRTIELLVKDDGGVADATKRTAQDLIVNEKVNVLAGFGLTPLALATAPLATQGKVPAVVMAAGTATITEASPFIVRTSFTLPQATEPMADWAAKNGIRKVVTLVSDYGPGIDHCRTAHSEILGDGKGTDPVARYGRRGPGRAGVRGGRGTAGRAAR